MHTPFLKLSILNLYTFLTVDSQMIPYRNSENNKSSSQLRNLK